MYNTAGIEECIFFCFFVLGLPGSSGLRGLPGFQGYPGFNGHQGAKGKYNHFISILKSH